MAVRWYLRHGLSYRDVEELLAERGVDVDHVTIYGWVQRFTAGTSKQPGPAVTCRVIDGSSTRRASRSTAGGRICTGRSTSTGSHRRLAVRQTRSTAARAFFHRALTAGVAPEEVTTDREGCSRRKECGLDATLHAPTRALRGCRLRGSAGQLFRSSPEAERRILAVSATVGRRSVRSAS